MPAQRLSFLINEYNGFTIELILKNYPVKSIRKIGYFMQSPWKINFISLLGKTMSLDEIEHGLVRQKVVYDDFNVKYGSVFKFLNTYGKYLIKNEKELPLAAKTDEIKYLDYDWKLNDTVSN